MVAERRQKRGVRFISYQPLVAGTKLGPDFDGENQLHRKQVCFRLMKLDERVREPEAIIERLSNGLPLRYGLVGLGAGRTAAASAAWSATGNGMPQRAFPTALGEESPGSRGQGGR